MNTNRGTPASAAALASLSVPTAFTAMNSDSLRARVSAPQCTMAAHSASAAAAAGSSFSSRSSSTFVSSRRSRRRVSLVRRTLAVT